VPASPSDSGNFSLNTNLRKTALLRSTSMLSMYKGLQVGGDQKLRVEKAVWMDTAAQAMTYCPCAGACRWVVIIEKGLLRNLVGRYSCTQACIN
jgi:hypothetical protein